MSLSSFFVVSNALRLNFFRMYDASKDKPTRHPVVLPAGGRLADVQPADACPLPERPAEINGTAKSAVCDTIENRKTETDNGSIADAERESDQEEKKMTKTLHVKGMMCAHCEKTVKGALEALPQVSAAEVSHVAGTAVVTLAEDVEDAALKAAVEAKDYEGTSVE